jgi:hypothetical protein
MSTVQSPRAPRRRVVRRRQSALDKAMAVAFDGLPPDIWPDLMAYADAKRAEYEGRLALGTALSAHHLRWRQADDAIRKIVYG